MEPRKFEMLLHGDVMYQILLWLPMISLVRFKLVCKSWRALIDSNEFIKHFLKDKKYSLIYRVAGKDSPVTFSLFSADSFEDPNTCVQLDSSNLHGYLPRTIVDIVSYNGIVCLNLLNRELEHSICLWNPATKQSRALPQLPALNKALTTVGFGFDVKSNDYKVVNLIGSVYTDEKRVEVYSLNTSAWRSVTTVFPFIRFFGNPRMPFNNGNCFFWVGYNSPKDTGIICFDFSSEMFRSISLPRADWRILHTSVVCDKIACVLRTNDYEIEIWVFNEYGTINESWTKFYAIDTYLTIDKGMRIEGVSMNGNYIFFARWDQMCRLNVFTKETHCFTLENMPSSFNKSTMVEFRESLVSVLNA